MDLIERVARAYAAAWKHDMEEQLNVGAPSWDEMSEGSRDAMRRVSLDPIIATLEGLREPSDDMVIAAEAAAGKEGDLVPVTVPFTAMIDAKLKEMEDE